MYKKILVAVDGSQTAHAALNSALQLAGEAKGRVLLVHVVNELSYFNGHESYGIYLAELIEIAQKAGNKILDDAFALASAVGATAERLFVEKHDEYLGDTIANAATNWGADLIVVGTHGRRGLGRLLLGSGAEQIIRFAPVPVLVVRSEDVDTDHPAKK